MPKISHIIEQILFSYYNAIMSVILHNSILKLKIETPAQKYRGSRFDWNGTVTQIWFNGKKMLSGEKMSFHRNDRIYGRGLHNEFGIKNCIGYDEIPVGEYFAKIGTGWLKKDEKPYFFYTQYKLEPLDFTWSQSSDTKAVFVCRAENHNGYAYTYTKTVELNADSFSINYLLENTGEKRISTTEYVHNFFLPCNNDVNPSLELEFNWNYDKEKLSENVRTQGLVDFTEKGIKFNKIPSEEYFLGGVWEARSDSSFSENGFWKLTDSKNGVTISEHDSFVPYHCDVWGHRKCISPELFIWLDISPSEKKNWCRTYKFE